MDEIILYNNINNVQTAIYVIALLENKTNQKGAVVAYFIKSQVLQFIHTVIN